MGHKITGKDFEFRKNSKSVVSLENKDPKISHD